MKLLLDTHVLLWWLDDPTKISESTRDQIADLENEVLVSAVSCWEIAIKRGLGKLTAPNGLSASIQQCGFVELAITGVHALRTESLPFHHKDPFDRMLIAQSICESATIVTQDRLFQSYGVPLIHA